MSNGLRDAHKKSIDSSLRVSNRVRVSRGSNL
jgi:hypothetical protein